MRQTWPVSSKLSSEQFKQNISSVTLFRDGMQSQRGFKNHFFHTHYLTTNEPLDVTVLLCYRFNCMRVSIQLLAAIQINQLID